MNPRSILLLAIGDPATDRRTQNFKRFFEQQSWKVESLSVPTTARRGPRRFLEYHRKLGRAVRSKSAEVVLAGDLYSLSAAAWMKRHGRARILLYDAREVYTELPTVARKPLAKFVWKKLERRGLLETDLIIVTAPHDAQAICDVHDFLPRPVLIRNLPWRKEPPTRDRAILRKFGIPEEGRVAVYVGGLQEGRALSQTVEAFRNFPGGHLLLIGDGILRQKLEASAPANVHFAVPVPSEEALSILAACDVGLALVEPVSRSYELALPSKLFEYMQCGIPVVASKLEHVAELFRDEEWITFVERMEPESICLGIEAAFANARNPALRERELALAASRYHFAHDAETLLELLERIP